jgi:hypothetical protein
MHAQLICMHAACSTCMQLVFYKLTNHLCTHVTTVTGRCGQLKLLRYERCLMATLLIEEMERAYAVK